MSQERTRVMQRFNNVNWEAFEAGFLIVPSTKENLFFTSNAVAIEWD